MNRLRGMRGARRVVLALTLVVLVTPFSAATSLADDGATVPAGFRDEPVLTGLDHPMVIVYAPNGNVFVAEKRGTIQFYSSPTDTTPTLFADLSTNVHNFWDRGLMGLAVDPGYPARPYVYVTYAYNHVLGDPAPAPRWPSADSLVPPGSPYDDRCPTPPTPTTDGCVISGRLSRLTVANGVMQGGEHVLIEDWCQQFPSHSLGGLAFGPEGALYVSAGDGASFTGPDYGQRGGTLTDTPTPVNPCGDPPGGPGDKPSPPDAEGGALRSQDLRAPGDPVTLDGTVLRLDPDTGAAWPANALIGSADPNARRIIGYGLRNPFRFTIRPGTSEVWVGDVGFNLWEELDRISDPHAAPPNFGWPCWEGDAVQPAYQPLGLAICQGLTAGEVAAPYWTYAHDEAVVQNDGCGTGSSSISGLAFLSTTSGYPDQYDKALFVTDYSRNCIWVLPAGSDGLPNASARMLFANLRRSGTDVTGGATSLTTDPAGDVVYTDYDRGEVRRIHYYGKVPPVARFTATPTSGPAPLDVHFDAGGSSDPAAGGLTYAWDLDGDGQYDDATGKTTQKTYASVGTTTVGLRVTDVNGSSDMTAVDVAVGNSPPSVHIDAPSPSLTWKVGDQITFSASATDPQDGTLPASAFQWKLVMQHCPSDCHSHLIQTFSGVTGGSFDAPDHEYPSHLQLSVTVTDANGATAGDSIDLYPKTGVIATSTNPAGIPLALGDIAGVAPKMTAIVGSIVTVTAPATAQVGEVIWGFRDWSDGGARTHEIAVASGTTNLLATYKYVRSTDASNTCAGAPLAASPPGRWVTGQFGTSGDLDWYRFKLASAGRVRLVLGDLPTTARLELYQGCTKLLQVADRGGTGTEEIIRSLPVGSYALRVVGTGGPSATPYSLLEQRLGSGARVLTARSRIEGSTLRLVGEVYNNGTRTVGPVTVTARLYNKAGSLLVTRSATTILSTVPVGTRTPFAIVGSLPAGYDHVTFSVSAPTTTRKVSNPTRIITGSGRDAAGHWVVTGSVRNATSTTVRSLALGITLYDKRGQVLDVVRATVGTTTLAPNASTPFKGTTPAIGLSPDLVYLRGMVVP
jgi:PKD repeat protein/glucose/arabinose dehydrogenase